MHFLDAIITFSRFLTPRTSLAINDSRAALTRASFSHSLRPWQLLVSPKIQRRSRALTVLTIFTTANFYIMTRRQISTQSVFQMTMAVILLILTLPRAAAYMQGVPRPHVKSIRSTSALSAWSIPAPPAFSTPSLGASWYNEVDPTARRTIYNDE
jgi:hypothetical protein